MRFLASLILAAVGLAALPSPAAAQQREAVFAADPHDISVTIYRDPDRGESEEMDPDDPGGFAMISETRMVRLPEGESTIRFDGVAEGMIGVSAIVTGLPGGTIEKNRNAELLSPAALVNGTLGNRVTITRTLPGSGETRSERAIVRTRADGGLVLQTSSGFEAVRCAGLPETLGFERVPSGLSAKPVFSIDTRDETGGTFEITLTYLAWGFDWEANYVGMMDDEGESTEFGLDLLSWLTVLNDNNQTFEKAQLLVVAGRLNVASNYEALARSPTGEPLRLTCYPIGSTAAGSPLPRYSDAPPLYAIPPPPAPTDAIVVTATRRGDANYETASPVAVLSSEVMEASEEQLGDLKLYRVPERVRVAAQSTKQIAFLNREDVEASFLYVAGCNPYDWIDEEGAPYTSRLVLKTRNDDESGLGIALPQGQLALYEPTARGPQLGALTRLRDYASGQEVELDLIESHQVLSRCGRVSGPRGGVTDGWTIMTAEFTNANPHPVAMRLMLGQASQWRVRFPGEDVRVKDGSHIVELVIPANSERSFRWYSRTP